MNASVASPTPPAGTPDGRGPVGILGAMDAEISEFLAHAQAIERTEWHGFVFHRIVLAGKEVVLVKSGVGKVFCALVSQHLIDAYAPDAMIFTGVAGALNPSYDIGDVVVSRDCLQHDVDGLALGFSRGTLLYTDWKAFPADAGLKRLALSARPEGHRIWEGRILTGDQFMTRDEINLHRYLLDELHGDAVEMEGGALAQVAAVNKIPYVVIRTISDRADGDAVHDFGKFLPVIAKNSYAVTERILSGYSTR
ncbi:MAG: 5'-methylthioadenosine/adenosylhomocysteine nucleosidase [Fibrobacterota bacterium]|nr:5'-methylthioadenosine/adenosylhomocysteine nucleosidase [Fibrobacterota bacterium]